MSHRFPSWRHVVFVLFTLTMVSCDRLSSLQNQSISQALPYVVPAPVIDTLAKSFYENIKEDAKREGTLDKDPLVLEQVKQVFGHLEQAAMRSKYSKTARQFKDTWELHVISDKKENAFAWPGGKIGVYSGIFRVAENEAGLALLLGHEMIHALARHAAHRISRDVIASLPVTGLAAGTLLNPKQLKPEVTVPIMAALGMGIVVGVDRPFAREHELEADYEGLLLVADAGYDPENAIGFFTRTGSNKTKIQYFSAHPSDLQRLKELKNRIDEPRNLYRQAKVKQESDKRLLALTMN